MFRRSDSTAADVWVEIANRPLYPGDAVEMEVTVTPHRPMLVTEGVVRLTQTELLRVESARDAIPQPMFAGRRSSPAARLPRRFHHVFAENVTMEAGLMYRYPVRIRMPLAAPPTVKGKHARITWEVAASVETRAEWAPNEGLLSNLAQVRAGHNSQEVVVFARPTAAALGGQALPERPQAIREHRNVHLQLDLDTGLVPNGSTIEGHLRVQPIASFNARELRVELSRWERSGNKQARVIEDVQVLQRPLGLVGGEPCEWAFTLRVPERLMPSVLARHTFVGWQVRAVVDRRLMPNLNVAQLIQVYTSP